MKVSLWCERLIKLGFYALFILTPLVFVGDTSELFEFNKMWFVFGIAIFIGATWITKMIFEKKISISRTILDIPLGIFLLSQLISTIFSLDQHVSFWGYYSRFNGGFLSLLTYIFLYYAFLSNTYVRDWIRMIYAGVISGIFVALWGLPSHFGYDPTCYVFRGTFDVSCWTDAFQPKVRIFSTLGQPDWLSAHLAVLIPIAISFAFIPIKRFKKYPFVTPLFFIAVTLLFYVDLIFTGSRSGYIAVICGIILFILGYIFLNKDSFTSNVKTSMQKHWILSSIIASCLLITFLIGQPIGQLNKFTLPGIVQTLSQKHAPVKTTPQAKQPAAVGELGGTDSGKIRLFVWDGAIKAWGHNVLFGTGVETFAYAYYLYRPAGHNLTSEWDYLYNKAHNEYLNYLTTTGLVGFGSYLVIIGVFLSFCLRQLGKKQKINNLGVEKSKKNVDETTKVSPLLILGLLSGYITILITNFFGFSVVTINFFFFLIPAFIFALQSTGIRPYILSFEKNHVANKRGFQYSLTAVTILLALFMLSKLVSYWNADKTYAYGMNLDHAGYWQNANSYLRSAVVTRPTEPVFQDELSINDAVMALGFTQQKDSTKSAQFTQEALTLSDMVTKNHPNNVVYWKTRVRIFYTLAQIDTRYLPYALQAIQKASMLAPTDAKVWYNLGLLLGQTGDTNQAISVLQKTIAMKNNYQDSYYALGLMYHQAAVDKDGNVTNSDMEKKAVEQMHYILKIFNPEDKQALTALKTWNEQ